MINASHTLFLAAQTVVFLLCSHNWHTIGPLVIIFVPKPPNVQMHVNDHSTSQSRKGEKNWEKKLAESVKYRQNTTHLTQNVSMIRTTMNASHSVQMFGLWTAHSWSTVTSPKKAIADHQPKYLLLCNVSKSLKEALADPTWVQLILNMVYMFGLFYNGQHAYMHSQQHSKDACVLICV